MGKLTKAITCSFNRNIGTLDRTIRTIVGLAASAGAIYYADKNLVYTSLFGLLAIAQFGTVFSARCILCYFAGQCTIPKSEKKKLDAKGIKYEHVN